MKKLIVAAIVILSTLTSCKQNSGQPSSSTVEGKNYKVEFLFEKDGVKVYRFMDNFNYHYFTSKGETTTTHTSGKTSYEESIQ